MGKLIESTFNGYTCLNVVTSLDELGDYRADIIKTIHEITKPITVRLIESLENATHHCGFLVVSNEIKRLDAFANVRYEDVIRVLYIDFSLTDDDEILLFDVSPLLKNLHHNTADTTRIFLSVTLVTSHVIRVTVIQGYHMQKCMS